MHLFSKVSPASLRPAGSAPCVRLSLIAFALAASLGSALLPARADEPRVALAGNAAPRAALRQARLLGRLDASTTLRIALTLPLRHQTQLDDLVRRQYTPGDPAYHQFLTPPEFTARFGPTQEDYDAVAAFARAQGLTVTGTSPGRTLLNVAGSSARIESAFGIQMSRYRLADGREVFANSASPRLPRSIAVRVAGIAGLSNAALMRPQLSRMRNQHLVGPEQSGLRSDAPVPINGGSGGEGSGLLGGLTPNDIKYAYGLDAITPLYGSTVTPPKAALTGAGQNIGLFELDGYNTLDIAQYVTAFSLPTALTGTAASVTNIPLDGFKEAPLTPDTQTEVTLDIDMVLALAPAATGVYVYEDNGVLPTDPTFDPAAAITIFTRMANDLNPDGSKKPLLSVISCSWGIPETLEDPAVIQGENTLFQQMAAQGQSLFCASGDQGAYDLYVAPTTGSTTTTGSGQTAPAVDNPASQPFATGVGGTTLSFVKAGVNATTSVVTPGAYVSETAWSAGTPTVNPEGGGGGISTLWAKPDYQLGVGTSPTRRDVPDVSLNADPNTGYSIYFGSTSTAAGAAEVIGGTSAAAPLWAAYTVLINEQRATNGLGSVGFLNPLLYPIAVSSSYGTDFHDITTGNNLFFDAGPGYDDATGIGSFIGVPLLTALSLNPNQGTGTATLSGTVTDSSNPPVAIAGATVSAINSASGAVTATATTDTTGAYTLTVPSGLALKIMVTTSAITAPATESFTGASVALAALAAGAAVTDQNFVLTPAILYPAGIQMISAPFDYSGIGDFASVFGLTEAQANLSPRLIQYDPLTSSYVFYPTAPADTLRLGQGYWVRFPTTNYLHIPGTPASTASAFSIPLRQGWNQIGDPFPLAAPFSSITVVAADGTTGALATSTVVQPGLYSYNTATASYTELAPVSGAYADSTNDVLAPYAGYWVFATQAATLSVPVPAGLSQVTPPGQPGA